MSEEIKEFAELRFKIDAAFDFISKIYNKGFETYKRSGKLAKEDNKKEYEYRISSDMKLEARWIKSAMYGSLENEPTFLVHVMNKKSGRYYEDGMMVMFNNAFYRLGILLKLKEELFAECGGKAERIGKCNLREIKADSLSGLIQSVYKQVAANISLHRETLFYGFYGQVQSLVMMTDDYAVVVKEWPKGTNLEVGIRKVQIGQRAGDWEKVSTKSILIKDKNDINKKLYDYIEDEIRGLYSSKHIRAKDVFELR